MRVLLNAVRCQSPPTRRIDKLDAFVALAIFEVVND